MNGANAIKVTDTTGDSMVVIPAIQIELPICEMM